MFRPFFRADPNNSYFPINFLIDSQTRSCEFSNEFNSANLKKRKNHVSIFRISISERGCRLSSQRELFNLSDLKNFNSPLPVSWRGSMKTLFFPVLHVCSFVYLSREYIVRHGTLTFVRGTFPDFIVGQHDPCLIWTRKRSLFSISRSLEQ